MTTRRAVTRRAVLGGALLALAGGCARQRAATSCGEVVVYGPHPDLVAELTLPARTPLVVVVLVHGGYWRDGHHRTELGAASRDLVTAGWATWNLDYRGTTAGVPGWPTTFADVAGAGDRLDDVVAARGLRLDRTAVVGHS
ncbi:alpha/beta hydrolase family protein, partial [Angustibacter aerolatus]